MTDEQAENSVFRILDAAINRAGEGIRVVEDYARMVLGDAYLSGQLKQLRHDLTQSVSSIDPVQRIAARDTVGDVGTTIQTTTEYERSFPNSGDHQTPIAGEPQKQTGGMIQANFGRAQQAIRTIEEFSKSLDTDLAKRVEQIRYRTYTLEKALLTTVVSLQNLAEANLYVLIEASGDVESLVGQLIAAKVNLIQLRDKTLNDRQLVETGRALSSLTRGTKTRFIMNDRADLAIAANADGVHLGQDDLKVSDARRIVGAARMIGVSTHSIEQARQAVLDGANYIGVGPVFSSTTKQFDAHVGLELLVTVANEVKLPSFAIGGINLDNVADVVRSGVSRVAVSGAILNAEKPGETARNFNQALQSP
jgi:thiamine-phosphate pyrophosphorylase